MWRMALVLPIMVPVFADIDIAVPPGNPMEWSLSRPTPPHILQTVPAGGIPKRRPTTGFDTVLAEDLKRRPEPHAGTGSLYNRLRVLTADLPNHVGNPDLAQGRKYEHLRYPPEMPTELVWEAAAAQIRVVLHSETTAVPEVVARLVELGEPALAAAEFNDWGPVPREVRRRVSPLPRQPPVLSDKPLMKLTQIELCGNYPHAYDPNYARKIYTIPEDFEALVIECLKDPHPLVSRNAVSVLYGYQTPAATRALLKVLKETKDDVQKFRAITALAARREKAAVPELTALLVSKDAALRSAAAHALGIIGDRSSARALRDAIAATYDADFYMSAIPALARLGDRDSIKFLSDLREKIRQKMPDVMVIQPPADQIVPVKPDPQGAKRRILLDACLLGMAIAGDKEARESVVGKLEVEGLDMVLAPTFTLLIDCLAQMKAEKYLARIATGDLAPGKNSVFGQSLTFDTVRARATRHVEDVDTLKKLAKDKSAEVAVAAMVQLYLRGHRPREVVEAYANGSYSRPEELHVVATAVQLAGAPTDVLIKVVKRAKEQGHYAKRLGENVEDITRANIEVQPPLLEVATLELGRTGDEAAIDTLAGLGTAEAALALGSIGGPKALPPLLKLLESEDGWTRYCAYKALKHVTGKDYVCDWVFGDAKSREEATRRYREAVNR